jgi:hypothetical protein
MPLPVVPPDDLEMSPLTPTPSDSAGRSRGDRHLTGSASGTKTQRDVRLDQDSWRDPRLPRPTFSANFRRGTLPS